MDDPTHKIIPAVLKKYNINAPPESYSLWIVYEDKERRLEWKSLLFFSNSFMQKGRNPCSCLENYQYLRL